MMSDFEAFKSQLFRPDTQGRRVFVPGVTRGPVLRADIAADADRVASGLYWSRWVAIGLTIASLIAAGLTPLALLGVPIAYVVVVLYRRRLIASLPSAGLDVADLPPLDRGERKQAYRVALGSRGYRDMIAAGVLLAVIGVGAMLDQLQKHASGHAVVWGASLVALSIWFIVEAVRSLRSLRQ